MRYGIPMIAAVLLLVRPGPQSPPAPLAIGETLTIDSAVLNETRRINVYTPAAYEAAPDTPFPVLYMPDGGIAEDFLHIAGLVQISSLNGTMRPFILVGIENTDRRRDLTGPTDVAADREMAPRAGGSAAFRRFIREELMPAIRARYRTTDETAIVGESLAGLFVVETFLLEPDLFDAYIAVDPSLWWNANHVVDTAAARLRTHPDLNATILLANSDEPTITGLTARLAGILRDDAPAGVTSYHQPQPDEQHATIFHPAAIRAFRTVFAMAPATEGRRGADASAIRHVWSTLDDTWNARDAVRFSEQFTPDASFQFPDRGEGFEGRPAILASFTARFPTFGPDVRHRTTIAEVRAITADVAAVDGLVEILRVGPTGASPPEVIRRFTIVGIMLRADETWHIHHLRAIERAQ